MQALKELTRPQWALWCSVVALAACETAWLYAALPGINWPLATLANSAGLVICWTIAGKKYRLNVVLPLLLACLLAGGAALTADPADDVLIGVAVLFALGSAVVSAHAPRTWIITAPYALVLTAGEAHARLTESMQAVRAGRGVAAIRGVALAAPITLVLALLLSQADPTLETLRDDIIKVFQDLSILPRGLFFVVLSVCLAGTFGIALRSGRADCPAAPAVATRQAVLGDIERLIVLGSVAALFAIFLGLQVSYLFGNPGGRAGSGVSYADAVHRGFAELNVAATVCGALLFALRWYALSPRPGRWLRVLEWIVTLQAQVLLASAFYRVDLYERAYGFTTLRLDVQAYAAVAFIAMILVVAELRGYPLIDRFIRRVLVVAAIAFGALVWGNSDAWIAHQNLLRYARTGQIDVSYLASSLGPDAVPELVSALPRLPNTLSTRLEVCIRDRYDRHPEKVPLRWFEWSLRRAALNQILSGVRHNPTQAAADTPPNAGC